MKNDFNFIEVAKIEPDATDLSCDTFVIYRETTTDVLWVKHESTFMVFPDPQTGLPLTYDTWRKTYKRT